MLHYPTCFQYSIFTNPEFLKFYFGDNPPPPPKKKKKRGGGDVCTDKRYKQTKKLGDQKSLCFLVSCYMYLCSGKVKGGRRQGRGRGGKTTSGSAQAWSSPSPRGRWRTGKKEETDCEIICGAATALAVEE